MTNVDFDTDPVDGYDPVTELQGLRRRPVQEAVTSVDTESIKMDRTYKLARATGTPPSLVYTDVDGFDQQTRAKVTGNIIGSNAWLREYIDEDPMRAKLSADDWGQLDEVTAHLEGWRKPVKNTLGYWTKTEGPFDKAIEGFRKGFGEGPIGQWTQSDEYLRNNRAAAAIWATAATPIEAFFRTLSGGIHGASAAAGAIAKDITGSEQLQRDVAGMTEQQLSGTGVHGVGHATMQSKKYGEALSRSRLWIDSGVEPPRGLHPEIDKIKERYNDLDVKELEKSTATAEASVTRERDPQSFADLVRMRDRGTIEIDAEAVHRLYGDKPPGAEDGLLGWVPRIGEQLELARTTGGDISIPIAEWLAHADGDLMKLLRDDIRVRPGGITRNEAKASRGADGDEINALRDQAQTDLAKRTTEGIEEGAAPTTQEQGRAGLAREGGEKPKIESREEVNQPSYDDRIGKLDTEISQSREVKGDWVVPKEGMLDDPLYQALDAITGTGLSVEKIESAIKWALENDRPDIAQVGIDRLQRDATRGAQSKPGVALDNPRYKTIEADLKRRAEKDQAAVDRIASEHGLEPSRDVSPEGVVEEFLKAQHKREIIPDDLPSVRAAAGLEPLFSIGDRKLRIEKRPSERINQDTTRIPSDEFRLLDENGEKVGWLEVVPYNGGKRLYIDNVGGFESKGYGPNSFGNSLTRDLARQLKKEYPQAEEIGGFRISGAREKAGTTREVWIKFEEAINNPNAFRELLEGGEWKSMGLGLELYIKPELRGREAEVSDAIREELARLAPKQADVATPMAIRQEATGRRVRGVHSQYTDRNPWITVAIDSTDPIGVARHEAVHHLRQQGFFNDKEWLTLERAAREQGWVEKFGIERRYAKLEQSGKLEEAIADGFREWKKNAESVPEAVRPVFERLRELFDAIKLRLKEIFGRDLEWNEIFQRVDEGEIGQREGNAPRREGAYRESVEDEGPQPPPLFRTPGTIGMTERQATLYARQLREMHDSDVAYETDKAEREAKRRHTAGWRTEKKNVQAEVDADFNARPDVAADLYFARGELFGEKVERFKIDPEDLKAMGVDAKVLPRDYIAKAGADAIALDDLASLVGYSSGKAMVLDLAKYNEAKLAANMSAKAFRDRLVSMEVERRMTQRHGDLDENIRDAAMDQVAGETSLNLLAEETLALGIRAGAEASINKAELREWLKERFEESPMAGESSEKYLRASGKAGTAAEIGLLKEKFDEAYRAKQQQYYAMTLMREARVLEKEQKAFAKLAKRLGKRDIKGLDPEFQDVLQMMLWQAGVPSRRSLIEIQNQLGKSGYKGLDTFVESLVGDGWEPAVTDAIRAGFTKPIGQMTVGEFREFKAAIESLNTIGRDVNKINVRGEKMEFAKYEDEVVERITSTRPLRSDKSQGSLLYQIDAALTRPENLLKSLDYGEEMGPLVDTIIRPISKSKSYEYTLEEQLSRDIKALPVDKLWARTLKENLPNTFIIDPRTSEPFLLTRENMINMMLNWGNRGNQKVMANGMASAALGKRANRQETEAFAAKLKGWFDQHAAKADWDYVQGVFNITKGFRDQIDTVGRNVSGTNHKFVEAQPIDTPHGTYEGGYYPLIRNKLLSGEAATGLTESALFGPDYFNAATPQNYLKERTGATYHVDFQSPLGMIPMRMQQVIHDIAYRDSIMNAAKILRSKRIRNAIANYYGTEYLPHLDKAIKDQARGATIDELNSQGVDRVLRYFRMNLVNHALPFNYKVLGTPDVGLPSWKSMADYFNGSWHQNRELADKLSQETPHAIYNMDRDFREAMQKAVGEGKLDSVKQEAVRWGYSVVSWVSREFRRATFLHEYNRALGEGHDSAKAAAIADSHVRERHSAVSLFDLPSVMRGGEKARMLTMFYGYANTMYNWQRNIPDQMRRGEYFEAMKTATGSLLIGSVFGAVVINNMKEDDTWAKQFAKSIPLQLLSTVPFLREGVTMLMEGIPPSTAHGSAIKAFSTMGSDIKKLYNKEPIQHPIKDIANVLGIGIGVPGMLQIGRTGQGLYDVAKGQQRPRNFWEWARLGLTGEARLKRQGER